MDLLTSPHITWQSRNTFISIYNIITKKYNFLSMTALGHHYSVYYRKMLVILWYMLNRMLKTNVEPRWQLKSNLELRWPPFVCHVIWAVFATRNARMFVRSEDSEPFVRRTSRMKKTSVRENTYVRNGPVEYAQCLIYSIPKVTGHNGHKPKRPQPKRPQTETATNLDGHRPKRPQLKRLQIGTATDRNRHKPKRPQTETATNQNKRPQTEKDTTVVNCNGRVTRIFYV